MAEKGTRLTDEWQPTDEQRSDLAKRLHLAPHQIDWLRGQFIDYFTGADATKPVKKDWPRAFKNWCERDAWRAKKIPIPENAAIPQVATEYLLWRVRVEGWIRTKFRVWPINAGPKPNEQGTWVPRPILQEFKLV